MCWKGIFLWDWLVNLVKSLWDGKNNTFWWNEKLKWKLSTWVEFLGCLQKTLKLTELRKGLSCQNQTKFNSACKLETPIKLEIVHFPKMLLCGLGSGGIISWPALTQACSAAAFYTCRQPELVTKVSLIVQILWAGCLWACNWPLLAKWCGDKERERIDFKSLLQLRGTHTSAASCFRNPLSAICSDYFIST